MEMTTMPEKDGHKAQRVTTASATDCTGLVPALPDDEQEEESYEALYPTRQQPKPFAPKK